jgi:hypothetical protein
LAVTVGKIGYNAAKYAAHYVATHGLRGAVRNLYAGGKSLAGKAWDWLQRKKAVPGTCGCFTAGTLVWSAMGPIPIEEIKKHDWVYAQNVETGETELREVTAIIVTPNAAGLEVVISHFDGETEGISTTDEHPFWIEADSCGGAKGEWKRADTLREGDAVRTLKGVAIIERVLFGIRRETVYNFTVEGLNNYRVGPSGVLVHNANDCPAWLSRFPKNARLGNTEEFYDDVVKNIVKNHGGDPHAARKAIHEIKNAHGLRGDENVYLDMTGNVYHPASGENIGSLLAWN